MPNGSTQPLKIKVPQEVEVLVEIACINVEMCLCAVYMSVECIQDNFQSLNVLSAGDTEPWRAFDKAVALAKSSLALTRLPRTRSRSRRTTQALPATNICTLNVSQLLSNVQPLLLFSAYSIAIYPFVIPALHLKESKATREVALIRSKRTRVLHANEIPHRYNMATTPTGASHAHTKPRTKLLAALRKPTSSDSSDSSADSASDASDVESKTSTPAKRLFKAPTPRGRTQTPEEEEEIDVESAYMRMKQRLAAEKETQEQQAQKPEFVQATTPSSDEEESMPVRKPVRKSTAAQQQRSSPRASPSPSVRSRQSSPGLFVSPGPSPAKKQSPAQRTTGFDSAESSQPASATDLQERVKRIRAERLAKQQQEAAQLAQQNAYKRSIEPNAASDDDAEVDRRLTQQSKPTRRAGKKAIEAMARDQQRISRNMQLTHQSKTKKRYTTKDLFAKFGFNAPDEEETTAPSTPERGTGLVSSDIEAQAMHDTPPTSPPRQDDIMDKDTAETSSTTPKAVVVGDLDEVTPVPSRPDKGKGRAPEFAHLPPRTWPAQAQAVAVRQAQVPAVPANEIMVELSDSDDDLKQAPKSRFAVFDKIRTKEQDESKSFVTLRHLAHLTSPKQTRKGPKTISRSEMHFSLAQRARQQAQKAREEKIEELKRRGIHVETAEEREKHQMEVEDLVAQFEKQRQEDLKLAKMEKKEAKANGETDELPSSDEEDGDYVGSGEENAADDNDDHEDEEEAELELSGSEDEQMEDEDVEDANPPNDLIDDAAVEDADSEAEDAQMAEVDELADDDDEDSALPVRKSASKRTRRVVEDDDESDNEAETSGSPTQQATQDDAMAAFGFGRSSPGPGLTQMFAGTMANLDDSQATQEEAQQDSLDFLRSLPETQPGVTFSQTNDTLVPNSQLLATPRRESQAGAETQFSLGIGDLVAPSPSKTQLSEAPEPTQDAGFSFSRSPAGFMAPISTVETVMMSVAESPVGKRTGKLQRGRREATVELSDAGEDLDNADTELSDVDDIQRPPKHRDAFRAMQEGAKKQKALEAYNKKTSAAKDIVEEQADESEDEYAGIGGASDDDSGEEDEDLKKMIDASDVKVDERQLAAFYA
jgi:mediator of replication checkpoint protein 1